MRLSSFPNGLPYLDISATLRYKLRDIHPTFTEWAMLGRGMNYSMPSCMRFDVDKWREHMDLLLSNATINLWVTEKGRLSVMSMQESTS